MTGFLSLIVAVIGLVIYFAAKDNAKVSEVGRILFFAGSFAFLLANGSATVGLLR